MTDANTNLDEHLDTYFVRRNGIDYTPVKNVGYTLETLTYMPSASIANKITNVIVGYETKMNNISFDIYDASGGIGGSTLSFLDNPSIRHVYTYEIVPERRAMQKVNVAAYNFQNKYTSLEEFNGIPADVKGVAVYFDPPWLPENVSGLKFSKDQYIKEHTVFAGHTLEEWLTLMPNASLIAFRVPPGYIFHDVVGWKIEIIDDIHPRKRNVRLIVALNQTFMSKTASIPVTNISSVPVSNKNNNDSIYNNVSKNYDNTQKYTKPGYDYKNNNESKYNKQYSGKPRYDQNVAQKIAANQNFQPISLPSPQILTSFGSLGSKKDENKTVTTAIESISDVLFSQNITQKLSWETGLVNFLKATLYPVSGDFTDLLLNNDNLNVWIQAFTEDSYDPVNNYDVLENLGDTVIKNVFTDYLLQRFSDKIKSGQINEKGISNLRLEYLSKPRQSEFSNRMKLPQYVRKNKNLSVSIHIAEDLLESFYGALFRTGNNVKAGLGYILCFNFTKVMFDDIQLNAAFLYDPSKTFVLQTFSSLGWGNSPKIDTIEENGTVTFSLYFTETALKYLRDQGFKDISVKFATATANSRKAAEPLVFSNALENLIAMGITNEWISAQKFEREFNTVIHPELANLIIPLRVKMAADDYVRVLFESSETNLPSGALLLQLKGYKRGYQRLFLLGTSLTTPVKDTKFTQQHIKLLDDYINSK
jgi:dsRNA-specific ribonuclease